jgi:hypothetical protein
VAALRIRKIFLIRQCCETLGTVMIYCGSGSYCGKVLVPVLDPFPDPDLFSTVFRQQKYVPILAFPMLEAALFQESSPLFIDFLTFLLYCMLGTGMH